MKVMKWIACSLLVVLALLLAPQPGQALSFSVDSATVNVGDTFSIAVSITDAVNLTNYQFDLRFNAAILQANSVTEGSFFATGDPTLFVVALIDNGDGLISGVSNSLSLFDFPAPSGTGQLATIEFTALDSGLSPLDLSDTFLNLSGSGFTVANGSVCVNGGTTTCAPAVPEPSSLWLLGLGGLVFWGVTRWSRFGVSAI